MIAYFVKRFLLVIPVLFVTAFLVFAALHIAPGDPVDVIVGPIAPESVRDRVRTQLGLDKPLPVQFLIYMSSIVRGNLGQSILNKRPVLEIIKEKLPITAQLGLAAFIIAYVLSIPLGIIAAVNRGGFFDWFSMVLALIGVSMPGFWLGLLLLYVFAVHLKWLPPTGYASPKHLILPAIALGLPQVGRIARITRSSMADNLSKDYIAAARTLGIPERVVSGQLLLKPSLIPTISILGLDIAAIIGIAFLVELIFNWPGLGRYGMTSMLNKDLNAISAVILIFGAIFVLANIIVDLVVAYLDPRIRLRSARSD